ncbi:MAG: ATP phosphoribosyltransferase [Myxococcales bacterium]|nr:ATP phosphoribosyltransferase [Polyangiaceae bacterium]MDW8250472.1 ATP phosphoribosyltransferase [Myxococcales bacterium]
MTKNEVAALRLALPKGRMQQGVFQLLADAGVQVRVDERGYRPTLSLEGVETKLLKPQNIIEMLQAGSRDVGFAGADWVQELEAELVEVLDLGLDPVRLVLAAPPSVLVEGKLPPRPVTVATEYVRLTRRWMEEHDVAGTVLHSYGATEVFPPEDADCIVDNSATGSTLRANGLELVGEVMRSSTRLYASPAAMNDRDKRARIEDMVLLLQSVLDARSRIMIELNVSHEKLDEVVAVLPCMKKPTLARLHGEDGYAVKAAVPRRALAALIPELKARGGTDLVVYELSQIVP